MNATCPAQRMAANVPSSFTAYDIIPIFISGYSSLPASRTNRTSRHLFKCKQFCYIGTVLCGACLIFNQSVLNNYCQFTPQYINSLTGSSMQLVCAPI